MPTRGEYQQVISRIVAPHLDSPVTAWRGVYQALLWFEHDVPHIIDGDQLVKPAWRSRAEAVQTVLAQEFGCSLAEVPKKVDLLLESSIFEHKPQRQNPLGIGFVTSLLVLLEHFSSSAYSFLPEEEIGGAVFPGITQSPRSKPDIVVVRDNAEWAVVSAKWSLRHDRLKDLKEECDYFKTLMPRLKFFVVTNEYSPARLDKVVGDYRIDSVFHVCKRLVVDVAQVNGRTAQLRDLSELIQLFAQ